MIFWQKWLLSYFIIFNVETLNQSEYFLFYVHTSISSQKAPLINYQQSTLKFMCSILLLWSKKLLKFIKWNETPCNKHCWCLFVFFIPFFLIHFALYDEIDYIRLTQLVTPLRHVRMYQLELLQWHGRLLMFW